VRSAVLSAADFERWDKKCDPEDDEDLTLLEEHGSVMEQAEYELRKAHDLLPKDPYTDEPELDDVRVKVWYIAESPLQELAYWIQRKLDLVDVQPECARIVFGFDD